MLLDGSFHFNSILRAQLQSGGQKTMQYMNCIRVAEFKSKDSQVHWPRLVLYLVTQISSYTLWCLQHLSFLLCSMLMENFMHLKNLVKVQEISYLRLPIEPEHVLSGNFHQSSDDFKHTLTWLCDTEEPSKVCRPPPGLMRLWTSMTEWHLQGKMLQREGQYVEKLLHHWWMVWSFVVPGAKLIGAWILLSNK